MKAYNGMTQYPLTLRQISKIGYISNNGASFTGEPVMIKGASGQLDTIELYMRIHYYTAEIMSESTVVNRTTTVDVILKIVPDGAYYIISYKPKHDDVKVHKEWVERQFL